MTTAASAPHPSMREAVIEQSAARGQADRELDALRVAVALEDVVDVVLGDDRIDSATLTDPLRVAELLEEVAGER